MRFSLLSLFPEIVNFCTQQSICGKALAKGLFELESIQIRDYAINEYGKVDDAVYGGGTGMLMMAEPIYQAAQEAKERFRKSHSAGKEKIIYLSPRGRCLTQDLAKDLLNYDHLILLCGHYEGVDARVLEELDADELSIGDYVLTGGELAASVLIDVVARMIPGVLPNTEAWQEDSHASGFLECNHYTRPANWRDHEVPSVYLSGHAEKISRQRQAASLYETLCRRAELIKEPIERSEAMDLAHYINQDQDM